MCSDKEKDETSAESPKDVFPIFKKRFKPKENPLKSIQETIQKSTPPRKKRSLLGKKESPGLTQMILDAGQKQIGPVLCGDCGLLYSPGDAEDEEMHRKAHSSLENLHTIQVWKNPNIVFNFIDGGYIAVIKKNAKESKHVLRRLRCFLEWIDSELSVISDLDDGTSECVQLFLYLYPTKRKNSARILGYAEMELLKKDRIMVQPITQSEESSDLKLGVPLQVGITRLWTDKLFRKKKIATRLVEAIRFNSGIPACIVPKDKIGILEPSEDGRAFMSKYSESKAFIYTYRVMTD